MSSTEVRGRIYELDLLRIIAALLVLSYHYTFRGAAQGGFSPVHYPRAIGHITRYGVFGVELFFFISGMVIMQTARSGVPRRFAVSRIVRLYPAYWVMVTISFVVLSTWGAASLYAPLGLKQLLVNLTMLQTFGGAHLIDGVYWTLAKELAFYGIVWLALLAGQVRLLLPILGVWVVVSGAAEILHPVSGLRTWLATDYAAFFVAGACCYFLGELRHHKELSVRSAGPALALMVVSAGLAIRQAGIHARMLNALFKGSNRIEPRIAQAMVAVAFLVVLAIAMGVFQRLGRPWMVTAGALTYPLYLVHQNVGYVLFTEGRSINRWALLVGVTVAMLTLAWLVHRLVEQPLGPPLKRALNTAIAAVTPPGGGRSAR